MKDFILKMDNILINEQYDKRFILEVLAAVKEYFKADACSYSMLKEEIYTNPPGKADKKDVSNIHIYGAKVEITPFLMEFLTIYQNNLSKLYELWKKGNIDSLTNVCNFNALNEKIENSKVLKNVGVAFVDANGLGNINNTLGHEEGDKMLKTVAGIINTLFRQTEIYRKGGDEFVLICENISKAAFFSRIERIKKMIALTNYSASFGAIYAEKTDDIVLMIKQADEKMYEEKREYKLLQQKNK